jgi:putative ABC transport system permease protein
LQADVYVQPPSPVARRPDATIDPEVVRRIQQLPGVSAVYAIRRMVVATEYGEAELGAFDVSPVTPRTFRFKEGNPQTIWAQFDQAPYLIVSEPFSYRFGVHAGDTLQLLTLRGWQPFFVLGVFYDYGSDVGVMLMDRSVYRQYFADSAVTGLALYAKPGISIDTLITQLAQTTADRQALLIRSNRALRAASMEVFDRTFQVTAVLRWLTILVALVGILAALMAMALERGKELGVLRALGLTPRELGRYVVLFTVLLGLTAGLLALPLGIGLAAGLIYVINWRSFGWTLQFLLPPEVLVQALLLALGAALVAGLYPAWKMAHLQPAEALRNA